MTRPRLRLYRSPLSHRPPLAYGGHCFRLRGVSALCTRCHHTTPAWALTEGLWTCWAARWCPGLIRALPAAGPQLDIYHAMGTTTCGVVVGAERWTPTQPEEK